MKVLFLSAYWAPQNNVPQRRWRWLTSILLDAGHNVDVIVPDSKEDSNGSLAQIGDRSRIVAQGSIEEHVFRTKRYSTGDSLTFRALNQALISLASFWVTIREYLVRKRSFPDVIVGTVPTLPTAWQTMVVAKMLKRPYVIDLRDAWPDLLSELDQWNQALEKRSVREIIFTKAPIKILTAVVEKIMLKSFLHAGGLFVTSEAHADHLRAQMLKLSSKKNNPNIAVVRNVFPSAINPSDVASQTENRSTFNVLYAGKVGRAQNLHNVLAAVGIARKMGTNIAMRVVGGGAAWDSLKLQSQKSGIEIEFIDTVKEEELVKYYQWADTALVHLTDWPSLKFAIPSKAYELMELGLHITAVAEGATEDLILQHSAGSVVRPERPHQLAELWVELANNLETLKRSGEASAWVRKQRTAVAPAVFLGLLETVAGRNTEGENR